MDDMKKRCFLVSLSEEEKKAFDTKRKSNGQTAEFVMRQLVLSYLKKGVRNA